MALLLLMAAVAAAQQMPPAPPEGEYVTDLANVLSPDQKAQVNEAGARLWRDHQVPFVAVTIGAMKDHSRVTVSIERFAAALFESYGTTRERWEHGILLLVSTGDRKARIETGGAWTGRFSGAANTIMRDALVPAFRRGEYGAGIVAGANAIADAVPAVRSGASPGGSRYIPGVKNNTWGIGCIIAVVLFIVVLVVIRMVTRAASPFAGGMYGGYGYRPSGCGSGGYGGYGGYYGRRGGGGFWSHAGAFGAGALAGSLMGRGRSSGGGGGFSGGGGGGFGGFGGGGGATGSW